MGVEAGIDGHLTPGTILNGTYEVVQRLFEGGMADIYEARHVRLTGRYAIKVLRRSLTAHHASLFDRFRREAEVTSSLRHPNIVQVLDFNQTAGGAAYFVMELLEGQNLRQHLEANGPLPLPEVVAIVEQVASGLAAAHGRGIVHRDLKPENIHVVPVPGRKEPFVKVLDFGISKVLAASTLTQEAMLVGTPHYMAPEQARGGSDDLDGRTDQFALGAITHELLTGQRLFEAEAVFAIIYRVMSDEAPSLEPLVGVAADQVIQKALAKNRDDRYPSVDLFAEALREAVFGPPPVSAAFSALSGRVRSLSTPVAVSGAASVGIATPALPAASAPTNVTPPATPAVPTRRSRTVPLIATLLLLGGIVTGAVLWKRPSGSAWVPAPLPAPPLATEMETTVRRLLAHDMDELSATAERGGHVSNLAAAIVGRIDDATFQDILSTEVWWTDFRAFGCAVLLGNEVKVAWHMPAGVAPAALARAVRPDPGDAAARAGLVPGSAGSEGMVTAAVASIEGVKDASLVLVRPVNRQLVASLALRANIVMLLSDGQKDLGLSVPESTMPEVERLVGKEDNHVLIDRRLKRLAVAVPWTKGLWLWGVSGWEP